MLNPYAVKYQRLLHLSLLSTFSFFLLIAGNQNAVASDDEDHTRSSDSQESSRNNQIKITTATWNGQKNQLLVNGVGAGRNNSVSIHDSTTGVVLGVAQVRSDGRWSIVIENPVSTPCKITAQSRTSSDTINVTNAPASCGDSQGNGSNIISHANFYETYEGSKTCNQCHQNAHEVHASVHYQWQGSTPYVVNMDHGGKLGGINDFCGYPDINFIGQLTNLDGETVDGGCATCHVGMGAKPDSNPSQAQLDNIDCLVCHSDTYKRKVERQSDGSFHFVPAPEKMTVPLIDAITNIQRVPTKGSCVNCHSYAGGGCNNKRGDIEEAHRNPPSKNFDVHMASTDIGGAGLNCTDCHITKSHRIAGRGTDLRPTDLDVPVRCTNCHSNSPHDDNTLNRHTERVDCTVCHIPAFAKIASTDMFRDFSQAAEVDESKRLYEPHIDRQANVIPEYRFFNGFSTFYQFGTKAQLDDNGRVLMSGPVGDIHDPSAKIYPFKHHMAMLPHDPSTGYILPMKMGILFQTGNIDEAIKQGATSVGWALPKGYDFIPAERYMGIFHEVSPKEDALQCNDCHNGGNRMNFSALGYTPKQQRNGRPLCTSCHEDESDEWSVTQFFAKVHEEHVNEERITCSQCHNF